MIFAGIIKRLRDEAPVFERRVGGTALYQTLSEDDGMDLEMPYAFVLPLNQIAEERTNLGENNQRVKERFAVMVVADNSVERKSGLGLIAADVLRGTRGEILQALMPWCPLPHYDNIQFVGARPIKMTRVRLWHQFEFQTAYYVGATEHEDCIRLREAYVRGGITGVPRPESYDGFAQAYPNDETGKLYE